MTTAEREIRADFDRETLTVYQAYRDDIADAALEAGRFVPPFSLNRMTWIKPSFLWLMARSGWARKRGQERVLAVRIRRAFWDASLAEAELSDPDRRVYASRDVWRQRFKRAPIVVQWDPERSLRGAKLSWRAIQVGVSRGRVEHYVDAITAITDETPRVRRIRSLLDAGRARDAKRLLPPERRYRVSDTIRARLGMPGARVV